MHEYRLQMTMSYRSLHKSNPQQRATKYQYKGTVCFVEQFEYFKWLNISTINFATTTMWSIFVFFACMLFSLHSDLSEWRDPQYNFLYLWLCWRIQWAGLWKWVKYEVYCTDIIFCGIVSWIFQVYSHSQEWNTKYSRIMYQLHIWGWVNMVLNIEVR